MRSRRGRHGVEGQEVSRHSRRGGGTPRPQRSGRAHSPRRGRHRAGAGRENSRRNRCACAGPAGGSLYRRRRRARSLSRDPQAGVGRRSCAGPRGPAGKALRSPAGGCRRWAGRHSRGLRHLAGPAAEAIPVHDSAPGPARTAGKTDSSPLLCQAFNRFTILICSVRSGDSGHYERQRRARRLLRELGREPASDRKVTTCTSTSTGPWSS